jgi:hypothetical protein
MTIPAIIFGVVLSSAYGTAFHFWKGGSLNKLILYVVLAWLGFWTGHFIGGWLSWSFAAVGPLNTGMATLGSLIVLVAGDWLGRIEVTTKS